MCEEINTNVNELDILGRDMFVVNCNILINIIFETTKSSFIMIDGEWGVGKTFVMNMLDEDLKDDFTVIKYNCWENSYYNDPLEAILSVMLDYIDESSLWSDSIKEKFKALGMVALNLLSLGSVGILNKTVENVKEYIGEDKNSIYTIIQEVRNYINSNKEKIIILVDEIDRCLPEYGVKTLERLYLLFKDMPNIVVVIANDKSKMEISIQNAFGYKSIDNYLEKFIDYTLKLDVCKKFKSRKLFEKKYAHYLDDFELYGNYWELLNALFYGKDVRHIDHVMNKAYKIHRLTIHRLNFGEYIPDKEKLHLFYNETNTGKTAEYMLMAELLIVELKELSLKVAIENNIDIKKNHIALYKYINSLQLDFQLTYEKRENAGYEYTCFWYLTHLAKRIDHNLDLGYFALKLDYDDEYMTSLDIFYELSLFIE